MNVKQYAFVTAYLKHRDPIIAYKLATGSESTNLRSLQSAANRMLNKPGVREEIQSVLKATRAEVEAEMAETTRTELMTIQRKREVLAQIINGQYTVMVRTKGKNCTPCTYFASPTIREVLTGIREDNKMAGHYAIITTTKGKMQQIPTTQVCPPLPVPTDSGAGVSRSDGGGILEQDSEMQQITTTHEPEEVPGSGYSPSGAGGETLAPEDKLQQITTTGVCPPQAGVSRSDGGGILEHDNQTQQIATTPEPEEASHNTSPLHGDRRTLKQDSEKQQSSTTPSQNTTKSKHHPGIYPANGRRGWGRNPRAEPSRNATTKRSALMRPIKRHSD